MYKSSHCLLSSFFIFCFCVKEYHGRHLSSEILEAWDWAAGVFSDAGARVVEVQANVLEQGFLTFFPLSTAES